MKIISFFAVLALFSSASAWQDCDTWCNNLLGPDAQLRTMGDFVVEVNQDGNTIPGYRAHLDSGCHSTLLDYVPVTELQHGNMGGDWWVVTSDLGPDQRTSATLTLNVDDNLKYCGFNGVSLDVIAHGWQQCWRDECNEVADRQIAIPDGLWNVGGPNELQCIISNNGGSNQPAAFGVNMCSLDSPAPQVANPDDPECRQVILNEEDGLFHLVVRDENGTMGCINNDECTAYTNPDSWCKPDGTCAGCNDWEGCCDLLPAEPVRPGDPEVTNPEDPACRQVYTGEDGLDHLVTRENGVMGCVDHTECTTHTSPASWCKPDGTCRGCDDWEGCCDLGPN